jgi:hypothetical protein
MRYQAGQPEWGQSAYVWEIIGEGNTTLRGIGFNLPAVVPTIGATQGSERPHVSMDGSTGQTTALHVGPWGLQ